MIRISPNREIRGCFAWRIPSVPAKTATRSVDLAKSAGDFANVYLNVDGFRTTAGSNFGIEVTNHRAFIPGGNGAYYELNGTGFSYANLAGTTAGLTGIEFALPRSYLTTDPQSMGFSKTKVGDRVTFLTSQSYGYTASGYDANDPNGLNPNATADRLGFTTYTVQATPEPMSLAPLGLGALAFRRRRA